MLFKKIQRTTTSEMIVEQILASLESGRMTPGDKLPSERELAEMFGVGKASVREAIRALTLMGYLEVFQGRGAFLKKPLPGGEELGAERLSRALAAVDSLDLVEVRNVLECKAVALAAARATERQIKAVAMAVAAMEQTREIMASFYEADLAFHQAVTEASNNEVLIEIMNLLRARIVEDRDCFLGFTGGDRPSCLQTAQDVLAALREGEAETAVQAMGRHLRLISTEVVTLLGGTEPPEV